MTELASAATRSITDPLAEWTVKRVRLDGRPFSFDGHAYLRTIFDDTSSHVVLCKAAQIGGTTWAILRSFHACLCGLNVMYFFPTRTDVLDFSRSRVGPLLADNLFLARQMAETDTAGLKKIGSAYLYLRGMQSSVGMKSVPADMIVFDELDESSPDAKNMAKERLAHSDYKRIIELSNPSLSDFGIDEAYRKSDRRHWTVKCGACGCWTALDQAFLSHPAQEVRIIRRRDDLTAYRACPKCATELDIEIGEWVAEYPDRPVHVVISRRLEDGSDVRQIVYLGVHETYAELHELIERFRVQRCVVDAMPEIHATRDFANAHSGMVWLCYFNEHQKGEPKWDSENQIVQVNRTEAMDLSRATIRSRERVLPRRTPIVEQFAAHNARSAKRLIEN